MVVEKCLEIKIDNKNKNLKSLSNLKNDGNSGFEINVGDENGEAEFVTKEKPRFRSFSGNSEYFKD